MMVAHPGLDLTNHDFCDPEAILQVDDDLMKTVLSASTFPLLDSWRSSKRVMTSEELLATSVDEDEDEDYQRFGDKVHENSLILVNLGLVLFGQSIGVLEDLIVELDEAARLDEMVIEPTAPVEQVGHAEDVDS